MALRYLFIDMNSFFASAEQQLNPTLRGKPVGIVPMANVDTTCCIAASVEAKKFGIRTGTPVWEARKMCPQIVLVAARHEKYIQIHERINEAVGKCLPVTHVLSIDEMVCKLLGDEGKQERAEQLAREIKASIRKHAGDWLRCSIGIAPNIMLSKLATDMQKPDGLVTIRSEDLPQRLFELKLTDFSGIGPRMERRFHKYGITTVRQFTELSAAQMCTVWGSQVHGSRWWYLLRGYDVPNQETHRRTVGHSHMLPPNLRNEDGARGVVVRLIHKAAARLRKINYWARSVVLSISYLNREGWASAMAMPMCQDTLSILQTTAELWRQRPQGKLMKVGVTLTDLVPARAATPSLFDQDRQLGELCESMDKINRAFGPNTVYFGGMFGKQQSAPMRISFTHIPDEETESAEIPRGYGWS